VSDKNQRRTYSFGTFALDTGARALSRGGESIPLTPKEYATLLLLVESGSQAVPRDQLMAEVWPDAVVGDTSLARNISSLRRHLGVSAIEVVPKFGYRFSLPVAVGPVSPLPAMGEAGVPQSAVLPPKSGWATRRAWAWSVATVLVLLSGLAIVRHMKTTSTAASDSAPTWTDPQTGLMWTRKDNGKNVTRQQALDYCQNLNLAGQRDWRLPEIDELQTLYDTSISIAGTWGPVRPVYWHVKGNLHLTGGETASNVTWLTDLTPAGEEQSYDFSFGRRNYDDVTFSADHRALCVRRSGESQ